MGKKEEAGSTLPQMSFDEIKSNELQENHTQYPCKTLVVTLQKPTPLPGNAQI